MKKLPQWELKNRMPQFYICQKSKCKKLRGRFKKWCEPHFDSALRTASSKFKVFVEQEYEVAMTIEMGNPKSLMSKISPKDQWTAGVVEFPIQAD